MKFQENLQAWEALYITSRTGNVTRTSQVMGIDVPKVSRLIAGLEAEFGFPLFDKSHRPFKPTVESQPILQMLEPLINIYHQIRGLSLGVGKMEILKVSAPPEMVEQYYNKQFLRYSSLHPNIQFSIRPEAEPQDVFSGKIDIAMINHRPVDTTGLVVRPILTNTTPVLTTPGYIQRYGRPNTPEDLKKHCGLLHESGNMKTPTMFLYKNGTASGILKWKKVFISHSQLALKQMLLTHQGITVDLFIGHVLDEIKSGDVIPILPGWERRPWDMCIVTRRDREQTSPALLNFVEWWAATESREAMDRSVRAREAVSEALQRNYRSDVVSRYSKQYVKEMPHLKSNKS